MATQAANNSITSREWVIPPRPKPGRKPATDTPPTKRKAQNRAAQRAFRERRAARVGELEDQLEEQREEHQRTEKELQDRVQGLDAEVQNLRSRCASLEDMLEKERAERLRVSNDFDLMRRRWEDERESAQSRNASLPSLLGRSHGMSISQHPTPRSSIVSNHSEHRNSTDAFAISNIISPPDSSTKFPAADGCGSCDPNGPCACVEEVLASTGPPMDCGKCILGTKCECLEAVLNPSLHSDHDLKRRTSRSALGPEEKRQKPNANENEIDFTGMFSKKIQPAVAVAAPHYPNPSQPASIPPRDKCGFCEEGTYCMCAEAANAAASQTLAPIGSQVQTPPPSDNDVGPPPVEVTSTGAIKLPSLQSLNYNRTPAPRKIGGCGANGPGTCAQCLADPKSGLFCRSLAATFNKQSVDADSSKPPDGCCGGSAGGACCKSNPPTTNSSSSSGLGVGVSCADAYKTLSSHRNFEKAADEIGAWLPKLRVMPHPQDGQGQRRLPIEVETASIMSVLKGFDVRFGREG